MSVAGSSCVMRKGRRYLRGASLITCAILAGCATPKPIRDLGSRGAATVDLAQTSLTDYLAASKAQLTARMELLRLSLQKLDSDRLNFELDDAMAAEAGVPTRDEAAQLIHTLAAERQRVREQKAEGLQAIADATMLDPGKLPQIPTQQLMVAKQGFASLSQELSASEWLALGASYAKAIQTGLDEARSGAP